ncbi:MAG: hypothetical protein WD081_03740 [Gammaproteobacteria bacterium]
MDTQKERWLSIVQDLGPLQEKITYYRSFSAAETATLRTGVWPRSMDDRWVVFLGDSWLSLWRSWTGHCIFRLPARATEDGVIVGPLFVNTDQEQYGPSDVQASLDLFESVINLVLAPEERAKTGEPGG